MDEWHDVRFKGQVWGKGNPWSGRSCPLDELLGGFDGFLGPWVQFLQHIGKDKAPKIPDRGIENGTGGGFFRIDAQGVGNPSDKNEHRPQDHGHLEGPKDAPGQFVQKAQQGKIRNLGEEPAAEVHQAYDGQKGDQKRGDSDIAGVPVQILGEAVPHKIGKVYGPVDSRDQGHYGGQFYKEPVPEPFVQAPDQQASDDDIQNDHRRVLANIAY